jgi:hypothetical protein
MFYNEYPKCVILEFDVRGSVNLGNNNNNIYYLQLGFHPVAVNNLRVYNL